MSSSLVIRSPFLPDEWLPSLLIRLAQDNYYDSPHTVIQLGHQRLAAPDKLTCPTKTETFQIIADLVRIDSLKLYQATAHRFHEILDHHRYGQETLTLPSGEMANLLTHTQRINLFAENDVQFCPLCLQEAAYHRLIWLPKAVSVCLKHRCLLVYKCPQCAHALYIRSTVEARCQSCGFNLTQAKPLAVADDEPGLLSQRIIQSWFQQKHYPCAGILDQPLSILYYFADGLRRSIQPLRSWSFMHQPVIDEPVDPSDALSPLRRFQLYATSIKALLNWPHGFYQFLDAYTIRGGRSRSYQLRRDFGHDLSKCIRVYWGHDNYRVIQQAYDNYLIDNYGLSSSLLHMDRSRYTPDFRDRLPYVTIHTASTMLGISPMSVSYLATEKYSIPFVEAKGNKKGNRLPTRLIKRADVLRIKKKLRKNISILEAAGIIGTSPEVIHRLVESKRLKGYSLGHKDGRFRLVTNKSVRRFMITLRFRTRQPVPDETIPIMAAVQRLSEYKSDLVTVIEWILTHRLRAYWQKK